MYLSPDGKNTRSCGSPIKPCKSLKYILENHKFVSTIKVIKVYETSLACENVSLGSSLNIVGINGAPVFDCSDHCNFFLTITKAHTASKPRLLLKNLGFRNTDCTDSIIIVSRKISLHLENVIIKSCIAPAVVFKQQHAGNINVRVLNTTFTSASGLNFESFDSVFLEIQGSRFIGDGLQSIFGVLMSDQRSHERQAPVVTIEVKTTTFSSLCRGISAVFVNTTVNLQIMTSTFTDNNAALEIKSASPLRNHVEKGAAISISLLPSTSSTKQNTNGLYVLSFQNVTFINNTAKYGGAVYLSGNGDYYFIEKPIHVEFRACQFKMNKALAGGAIYLFHVNPNSFFQKAVSSVTFKDSFFWRNVAANNYASQLLIDNERLLQSSSDNQMRDGNGGAINCRYFVVDLVNTSMIDNFANQFGGTIFDRSCKVFITDSKIMQNEKDKIYTFPLQGQIAYTAGTYFLNNFTVEANVAPFQRKETIYVWFSGFQVMVI